MKTLAALILLLAAVVLPSLPAQAHCDAVDGPVATAARKALDTKNVNLVLPYAPAEFERELTAAFEQALLVRNKAPKPRRSLIAISWRPRCACTGLARTQRTPA